MELEQLKGLKSMGLVHAALVNPLNAGELGVTLARAGVGKTACLTHLALEQLLSGSSVLHVCLNDTPEKIKVWYLEFIKNITASQPGLEPAPLQQYIEPRRLILAYLHKTFTPEKLEQSLLTLKDQAKFKPSMLILDGMDFDRNPRESVEKLKSFALRNDLSVWMSARTHRHLNVVNEHDIPYPCNKIDDLFAAIILLEPVAEAIQIRVLKHGQSYHPAYSAVFLNPQTYMLQVD